MRQNTNDNSEIRDLIIRTFQSDFQSLVQKIRNSGRKSLSQEEERKFLILYKVVSKTRPSGKPLHEALLICFPSYDRFYKKAINSSSTSSSKERQTITPNTTTKKIHEKLMAGIELTPEEREIFLHIVRICIQPLARPVSSNISLREKQKSSSRKRARADDSFDMSSGEKQKSSSTTTAKDPRLQNEIKRLIRPVASAIKEIVRPYTGLLSITELNSIIVQEVVLNSSQQSTSRSIPQPPNTRLQRSSYRGPSLPTYSTVPPSLQPYSTVPPPLQPYSTVPPPLPPYSTVPPRQFLNTGSLNMMNNSNSNTGPQFNRNTMRGAPLMPYSTVPPDQLLNTGSQPNRNTMRGAPSMSYFNQLPLQEKKRIMQRLRYENRNRDTIMRPPPLLPRQAGRNPMTDSKNGPPNMKNP